MFAVGAIMMNNYTMMANNMAFRGMMANNARMNMLSHLDGHQHFSYGQLAALNAMDTNLEIDAMNSSLQYKCAKAMIESLKKLQKEDIERSFNLFA